MYKGRKRKKMDKQKRQIRGTIVGEKKQDK